jgi:hypothetical protein
VGNCWIEAYNNTYQNEKMAMDRSYFEEGRRTHRIKTIGLESVGSQKERKTEEILEKDHFGGSRKKRQSME